MYHAGLTWWLQLRPQTSARASAVRQSAPMFTVSIQTEDFDVSTELKRLRLGQPEAARRVGAACCFVGLVREHSADVSGSSPGTSGICSMELEHYPEMTEKSICQILEQARQRFGIEGARVIHRVGVLAPSDQIVLVAVTSAHRGPSFLACEFIMDYLKSLAPFWKKEQIKDGGARWVDARESDEAALKRWQQ